MLVNRRSFLKGLGGLAVAVTLPKTEDISAQGKVGWFYQVIFINGKRLPAHQTTCKLVYYPPEVGNQASDRPVAEFIIKALLRDGTGQKPDCPLGTPVDVRVVMVGEGLTTYTGRGTITQYHEEYTSPILVYHMTIVMQYVCST